MRRSMTNRLRLLACGLLFVGSLVSSVFLCCNKSFAAAGGQNEDASSDRNFTTGLANLPADLKDLWSSLTEEPELKIYSEYYAQARQAIQDMGSIISSRDGYIPQKRDPEYNNYQNMLQRLKEALALTAGPVDAEALKTLPGLARLPVFLKDRWLEQVTYSDLNLNRAFFREGWFLIERIDPLITANKGLIPKAGDTSYAEYQQLKAEFVKILDDISYRASQHQEGKVVGLEFLPEDIAARWIELVNDENAASYHDFIIEGEGLIIHLGSLVQSLQGKVPKRGEPGYEVYEDIINRIRRVLEGIIMKYAFSIPTEAVDSTLNEYLLERGQLSQGMKAQRQELLKGGLELLRERQNDEIFLKYPHRRATIAGLYFRVAELMYEEAYDQFLEETDRYIEEFNRLSETNPDSAALLLQPSPDFFQVQSMFQRILDEFPTSDYADDALYNIGLMLSEEGSQAERDNANRIFETLVSIYPESDYKLNALRRIAEYYFNPPVNNIEKSIEVYTAILAVHPGSQYHQEALYKLGWAYYRINEPQSAVEYFARSLDESYKTLQNIGSQQTTVLDIAKESINYIGICFSADERDWNGAGIGNLVNWLNQYPDRKENYGRELVIQLGEIYRNQIGQYAKAVAVYARYIDLFPNDPQAPLVQSYVVEIYQQGEIFDIPRALEEKKRFFAMYNPDSEWWGVNKDVKVRNDLVPRLEKYLNLIIDEDLVLATETKDKALYDEFSRYCRQYLRFWPSGPNAYKVQANLATVLKNQLDRPTDALREFWQVATAYEDTSRREAACNEVVIITNDLVKQEREGKIYVTPEGEILPPDMAPAVGATPTEAPLPASPESAGESPAPAPAAEIAPSSAQLEEGEGGEQPTEPVIVTTLLNSERLFLQGIDLYYYNYPQSALASRMLYQASDILYEHKMFPESRVYLCELIAKFPQDRLVEDAYRLLIEGHFQSGEYAAVEDITKDITASNLSDTLKSAVTRRKAQSLFLSAKELKTENNHIAAAKEFMRVALETPDFEEADRSLFLAGNEFMLDKAWKEANEAFLLLAEKYPRSERADKALFNVAVNLQQEMGDAAGSAQAFERLVNSYPNSSLAQKALANASANYNEAKDHRSAIRVNEQYVAKFPSATDCDVYLFENAGHYLALDEVEKANEIYIRFAQKYPNDPRTIQAYFERGLYFLKQKDRASAEREFRATVEVHNKVAAGGSIGNPKFASKALAQLLDWEHREYDQLKYNLPEAQLAAAKERKKQWRNSLYEKYRKLIDLGQKEGYQAFYQVGRLDEELALASFNQERPPARKLEDELVKVGSVVDESIILNSIAISTFRESIKNLQTIHEQLLLQQDSLRREYNVYSQKVAEWQKAEIPGAADSLQKQNLRSRILTELDSAVSISEEWIQACRNKIPDIASRNGDYLKRLWALDLMIKSTDKNEEIRLLYREEVLNSAITPLAPEICGLYLQAIQTAVEFGRYNAYREALERGVASTIDTLRLQYEEQCGKAKSRIDRYISQYETILPKGEDARSVDGYYADEMGIIIQYQIDYLNSFTLDWLKSFSAVMDSISKYTLPPDFAGRSLDKGLQSVLDWHDQFLRYKSIGETHKEEYATQYAENGELLWDDASIAFEDLAAYASEYDRALLEEGLRVKTTYDLAGPAGIQIMRTLVEYYPETYAAQFGLTGQHTSVVSSLDWKVWPEETLGFESVDFDDSGWRTPNYSAFPYGSTFGVLDSLGARAVWYRGDKPTLDLPEEMPTLTAPPTGSEAVPPDTLQVSEADSLAMQVSDTAESAQSVERETPAPPLSKPAVTAQEREAVIKRYNEALADWEFWCALDSAGARRYLFRKAFDINTEPSAATVWVTVDDNFSCYVNGVYIAADKADTVDWMRINQYDVGDYLQLGKNVVAVEAVDVDSTGHGLIYALMYESIPDISSQLQLVASREAQRQDAIRENRAHAWLSYAGSQPQEVQRQPEPTQPAQPTAEEQRRFLIEKKRLF